MYDKIKLSLPENVLKKSDSLVRTCHPLASIANTELAPQTPEFLSDAMRHTQQLSSTTIIYETGYRLWE